MSVRMMSLSIIGARGIDMNRKYYEAYDDRYRQVHELNLQWFCDEPTPIVMETLQKYGIQKTMKLLELGCGEGRDAFALLNQGYDLLAADISPTAIAYCKNRMPSHSDHFQILDCIAGTLEGQFDFIYAVAVVHMLVEDADRNAFYRFIYSHLTPSGKALICTMGDGEFERSSDVSTAFQLQERVHEKTGTPVKIAGTSCRMVGFSTFAEELNQNGFTIVERGMTAIEPDFSQLMYAVVCRGEIGDCDKAKELSVNIRRAEPGDEEILAHIQTQSWKAAFADILDKNELERCTNIERVKQMYHNVLKREGCNVAIEYVEDKPHCIAAWGKNRCGLGDAVGELICIHSLQNGWRKGYGSAMMQHVLAQLREENYASVILWVFEANTRARAFYEKHGFKLTGQEKLANGIVELMYRKNLEA